MTIDKLRLLFFGSDEFSIRVLKPILDQRICPIQIVTKPRTLLGEFSRQYKLPYHFWQPGLPNICDSEFNIGLVASFGQLIDPVTVRRFRFGLFNTHPSLLPQYRGSTPVQAAVFDRSKETGCTIMRIPPLDKFDIGDIVSQKNLEIRRREYAIQLRDRLADLGSSMVIDFLLNYSHYMNNVRSQGEQGKSFARKLKPEQGCLKFKTESFDLIDRKVLAYTGFIQLYTSCLNGLRVELNGLSDPELVENLDLDRLVKESTGQDAKPGGMYFHRLRCLLCIKACDGNWAAFVNVTPRFKPKMGARDFNNGYLSKVSPDLRMTDL